MDTAKFCTQCGKLLPPGVRHCPDCGAEVTVAQTIPPVETGEDISSRVPPQPAPVAAAQPTEPSPRARPRKRLGGGGITLLAGLIMLAVHVLVLEGGMTVQNIGVDAAIIACGLVMLFARGGLSVALALFASLCVSILDVVLQLAVFKSATASGSQGFQTLLSSMEWVSVIGMILVLLGFLAALGSLFRRS